jgi:DNA-binding CsgD family transcriptional regulator
MALAHRSAARDYHRSAAHHYNREAPGLQLLGSDLEQLQCVLKALLAERFSETIEQWRRSVLQHLRVLTCSDKALLILWSPNGRLVYGDQVSQGLLLSYANGFADLDRGPRAAREFGLEVWSLRQLWLPGELERSQYYRLFADPNGLHDSVGVTLQLADPSTELCMVFHRARPGPHGDVERRRQLLGLMLEPLRAAFRMDVDAIDPMPHLCSLIDVCGQALALYGLDGRLVKQNAVMLRVLAQDPERDAIQSQVHKVAQSTVKRLAQGQQISDELSGQVEGTRREVVTSQATYRLRGNLVGRIGSSDRTAILVSLNRVAFQIPAPDRLRAQYGLTVRELQVASLLMHRMTNLEIARTLRISPHTARHHTENVLAKLGVQSRKVLRRLVTDGVAG